MPISLEQVLAEEEVLEPETIRSLGGESMSSLEVQKFLALNIIKKTQAPWVDFYVFEDIVHLLNNIEPDVENIEGATPEMIWVAVNFLSKTRPDLEFEEEVIAYMKYNFMQKGITFLPEKVDPNLDTHKQIKLLAEEGPFPLNPDLHPEHIQAIHYLRLKEYEDKWQL
jgi:hypothetical protein